MTSPEYLIIRNQTLHGDRLRPSDWAERLASAAATFENNRLVYSTKVTPCKRCEDRVCLKVHQSLKQDEPELYRTITDFMNLHQLRDQSEACPRHPMPMRAAEPVWLPAAGVPADATTETPEVSEQAAPRIAC